MSNKKLYLFIYLNYNKLFYYFLIFYIDFFFYTKKIFVYFRNDFFKYTLFLLQSILFKSIKKHFYKYKIYNIQRIINYFSTYVFYKYLLLINYFYIVEFYENYLLWFLYSKLYKYNSIKYICIFENLYYLILNKLNNFLFDIFFFLKTTQKYHIKTRIINYLFLDFLYLKFFYIIWKYRWLLMSKDYYFYMKTLNSIYYFTPIIIKNINLIKKYNYSFIYFYTYNFYNTLYSKNNYLLWELFNDKKQQISYFYIFFTHLFYYTKLIYLWCIYYNINIIYFKKLFFMLLINDLLLNFFLIERKANTSFFRKLRFLLKYIHNLTCYNNFILISKDMHLFSIINIFYLYLKKLVLFIHLNYLNLNRTSKGLYR